MKTKCVATQMSDQMVCMKCQMSWDVNDSDEPMCQAKGEDEVMLDRVLEWTGDSPRVDRVRDMSLRDHFAATALYGLETDPTTLNMSFEQKAEYCYKMADAMMKQRLK